MATNEVNLGIGAATGMFYHAPAGTALPATPSTTPGEAWEEVGYISEDGITFATGVDRDNLRNWAKKIVRTLPGDDDPTVQVPIISTTAESLKTVFGDENVTVTPATGTAGKLVKVDVSSVMDIPAEAYLFIGKDGDDLFMLGTTEGFITSIDDVEFVPGEPITWHPTISAAEWSFMKEEPVDSSSD